MRSKPSNRNDVNHVTLGLANATSTLAVAQLSSDVDQSFSASEAGSLCEVFRFSKDHA